MLISMVSILMGMAPMSSLPSEPTELTPEIVKTLELTFGVIVLSQLVFTSFISLWLLAGRMTPIRIAIVVVPLAFIYLFKWLLVEHLDVLLFLTAWLTMWFVLIERKKVRAVGIPETASLIRRHVLEDEYELRYDGLDEMGFGRATNPKTGDRYLLNRETIGYHPQDLKKGQRFAARVTPAHVVEITEILDAPYLY